MVLLCNVSYRIRDWFRCSDGKQERQAASDQTSSNTIGQRLVGQAVIAGRGLQAAESGLQPSAGVHTELEEIGGGHHPETGLASEQWSRRHRQRAGTGGQRQWSDVSEFAVHRFGSCAGGRDQVAKGSQRCDAQTIGDKDTVSAASCPSSGVSFDGLYIQVVPKIRTVLGPQNFVKISVKKQTTCQNFQNYV